MVIVSPNPFSYFVYFGNANFISKDKNYSCVKRVDGINAIREAVYGSFRLQTLQKKMLAK